MNRYDRSPMEQAILERDRFQDEVCRLQDHLKRHKEALEMVRVALCGCDQVTCECWVEDVREAISAINDLFDKKGDK